MMTRDNNQKDAVAKIKFTLIDGLGGSGKTTETDLMRMILDERKCPQSAQERSLSAGSWNTEKIKAYASHLKNVAGEDGISEFIIQEDESSSFPFLLHPDNRKVCFNPQMTFLLEIWDGVIESYLVLLHCIACSDKGTPLTFVEKKAKALSGKLEMRYLDWDELEEYTRYVRRAVFPDPLHGGCFYRIGDILRARIPGGGPWRYKVIKIEPSSEGVMVTIRRQNDETAKGITFEEAEMYRQYGPKIG